MSHVDVGGPDDCWPWSGPRRDGPGTDSYGRFRLRGKTHTAHRWLLGHLRGRPLILKPVGLEDGCHRCDFKPCCNPAHLYVGTRKQNVGEAVERSRLWQLRVTHCPTCGSEYTYNPSGRHRRCKVCESTSQKASRRRAKTHCKHKHLLEGDNVIVCSNGTRKCRTCEESRIAKSAAWLTDKWADDPDGMTTAMKRGRWPAAS